MTLQLDQAIHIARTLSQSEQLELLKILAAIIQQTNVLELQNKQFWLTPSIEELSQEQQQPIIYDLRVLGTNFWDDSESTDEFIAYLHQQRRIELIDKL